MWTNCYWKTVLEVSKAKQDIRERISLPELRAYHIMISHSWDYNAHYEKVCGWLDAAKYFIQSDYLVPLSKPLDVNDKRELQDELRGRISKCSCVIVLLGM